MPYEVRADRLARLMAEDIHLRLGSGAGANGHIDVCLMQAVDWLAGGNGQSYRPECASRVIASYCVRLNDSPLFSAHRDMLKPYAPKIVGTKADRAVEFRRMFKLVDYAVRVFTPIRMRAFNREKWAAELENLPPIVDQLTSKAANNVASKIHAAAAYAAYADVAAYAADVAAAYAADVAAYAAADVANAAADVAAANVAAAAANVAAAYAAADAAYADAAYAAADVAATYAELRAKALEALDAVIAIGADDEVRH